LERYIQMPCYKIYHCYTGMVLKHKEGEYLSLIDSSNISAIREGSVAMNSKCEIKAKGNITHEV